MEKVTCVEGRGLASLSVASHFQYPTPQTLLYIFSSQTDVVTTLLLREDRNTKLVLVKHSGVLLQCKACKEDCSSVGIVAVRVCFFHTPCFPSSQSLSWVLHKSTVTTSMSLFNTPLHSLGWASVTQTIKVSTWPFRVMLSTQTSL